MTHLDQETLSLIALGEQEDAARLHLEDCDDCRAQVAMLERVVHAGRALVPGDSAPLEPPPLWPAIAAELGLAETRQAASAFPQRADTPTPEGTWVPLIRPRRRRPSGRVLTALAAAACLALVAVFAVALGPSEDVIAEVVLAPLDGGGSPGTAQLVREGDTLGLRLEVDGLPAQQTGYYEVWMATQTLDGLVSLGPLTEQGAQPIPAGLAIDEFPVVDVSEEAFDGDPSHSGISRYRGELPVS